MTMYSEYKSGGLGLLPSSFSLLIASMCIFQLYYQVRPVLSCADLCIEKLTLFECMLYVLTVLSLPSYWVRSRSEAAEQEALD